METITKKNSNSTRSLLILFSNAIRNKPLIFLIMLLTFNFSVLLPETVMACTTFQKGNQIVQTFDWDTPGVRAVYSPSGVELSSPSLVGTLKSFIFFTRSEIKKQWKTKFASYTFVHFHDFMPQSGMNEKGLLVIGLVQKRRYQVPSSLGPVLFDSQGNFLKKPLLNELGIMRYWLDNFDNKEDAILALTNQEIDIQKDFVGMHYVLCDINGCKVVEAVNGKWELLDWGSIDESNSIDSQGTKSPPIIVNIPYSLYREMDEINKRDMLDGNLSNFEGYEAYEKQNFQRFNTARKLLSDPKYDNVEDVLSQVFKPNSQWTAIFDLERKSIRFATRDDRLTVFELNFQETPNRLSYRSLRKVDESWIDIDVNGANWITYR